MDHAKVTKLLADSGASKRLLSELKIPYDINLENIELIAIQAKSGKEGVLIFNLSEVYALPYELLRPKPSRSGSMKPVVCDFCFTWLAGTNAAILTFRRSRTAVSHSFYVCADLHCSANVRGLTEQSRLSRTQLREDITEEGRIVRLKTKLESVYLTCNQ